MSKAERAAVVGALSDAVPDVEEMISRLKLLLAQPDCGHPVAKEGARHANSWLAC